MPIGILFLIDVYNQVLKIIWDLFLLMPKEDKIVQSFLKNFV